MDPITASSYVYYFWEDSETNTHGATIASNEKDEFELVEELTFPELSAITAPEDEGGNGEGPRWGDALVSNDGSRIFANGRNADKVVVINTKTREVEAILDVGDRPVHSYIYEDEVWVHVDGDGGFNIIDQNTLEVSELISASTGGTGHGKLLVSPSLGINTYATLTEEPAVFPVNVETREVGPPIEIAGGDPEIGTHDKGYDPATGLAFFQLTDDAGFSFIDASTNEVVFDLVPIIGRITGTPDENYILILNAGAEENDIGIWNTTLDTHTQPEFDDEVTIGGGVSVNGTKFYLDGDDWEAWIPQTSGDNVAVLNLTTNEVDYIEVGNLTIPEGSRHFSRRGDIDGEYFFTYDDEGGVRIDLDSYEVSDAVPLGGEISRMAVVEFEPEEEELIATTGDTLVGGAGDETLNAASGGGSNWLFGGDGNDVLLAGSNDILIGGSGDDMLFVGSGRAVLVGGAGADGFWIVDGELPEQVNVVRDFQQGTDVLGIRGLTPETVRSLRVLQVNENTLIQIECENVALLRNTIAGNLSQDDFVVV